MNTRHISLLSVMQVFALGCVLLFAAVDARCGDYFDGRPLPALTTYSYSLRDYGVWASLLIVGWVLLAVHAEKSGSRRYVAGTTALGIGFSIGMLLLAVACAADSVLLFRMIL